MMETVDPHDRLIISLEMWLTDLKADEITDHWRKNQMFFIKVFVMIFLLNYSIAKLV